jgi:hypothetical protein
VKIMNFANYFEAVLPVDLHTSIMVGRFVGWIPLPSRPFAEYYMTSIHPWGVSGPRTDPWQ